MEEKGPGKYRVSQRITVSSSTVSFLSTLPRPRTVVEKAPLPFLLLHNSVHGIIRRYLISAAVNFLPSGSSEIKVARRRRREEERRRASLAKSIAFIASSAERFSCSPREVHATPAKVAITGRVVALPPSTVQAPRRNESRSRYTRYNVACNSRLFPILWPI